MHHNLQLKWMSLKREYEDGISGTVEWLEREPFWIYSFKDKNM